MLPIVFSILGLSLLVIVHEGGHYLMARAFGIRVAQFSIGFGPVLARVQPKGSPTVFQVAAIPFLAYVMYANPEDADPQDQGLYANKGVVARAFTVLGGPLANYVAASVMIFFLAVSGWRVEVPRAPVVVDGVEPGSPAAEAGLRSGDMIREADGQPIRTVEQLSQATRPRAGQTVTYVIERDGQRLAPVQITPRGGEGRGVIGVTPASEVHYRPLPVGDAAGLAMSLPWVLTIRNLEAVADLVRRRTTEGVIGPVGMGKLVAQQAVDGAYAFVWVLMLISVTLGCMNLLPFPALDGGKLMFLGYELITRRRPNERIEGAIHALGILSLLGMIAFATLRDVGS